MRRIQGWGFSVWPSARQLDAEREEPRAEHCRSRSAACPKGRVTGIILPPGCRESASRAGSSIHANAKRVEIGYD